MTTPTATLSLPAPTPARALSWSTTPTRATPITALAAAQVMALAAIRARHPDAAPVVYRRSLAAGRYQVLARLQVDARGATLPCLASKAPAIIGRGETLAEALDAATRAVDGLRVREPIARPSARKISRQVG